MSHLLWGAFWIAVYLALVFTPLLVLLLGPLPPGAGFWWDLSLALGFAATAMMGVQFVLTARFRRATAPYGIDIIYYFHRYLAVVGFVLVLLHPLLLFIVNPPLLHLLNPFEAPSHMTAGVGSVLALIVLLVSSLWRKRLGIHYDAWRMWHAILAVVALTLALLHIEGVGYYIAAPWKRRLWAIIVLSWLAVLAYVRVVKPWRLLRAPYRVADIVAERGDSWTLALEPEGHAGITTFEPGQFVWMTLRGSPFAFSEHPFSISSSPTAPDTVELTIKELGDFTRTIKTVRPGERAYLDGPFGAFSIDRYPAPGYVFIAGGIGSAPMMSMLRALADRGDTRPHLLILANSRWERVTFREAAHALAARLDLRIVHFLEEPPDDWDGEVGYVSAAALRRHLPAERSTYEYFVCGPEPMIAAVEKALYQLGVPMSRFHTELFDLA
jgi:predicted ferric reductase